MAGKRVNLQLERRWKPKRKRYQEGIDRSVINKSNAEVFKRY